MKKTIIAAGCAAFFIAACKHEIPFPPLDPNSPPIVDYVCDENVVYFQQEILPLLVSSCSMPNQPGEGCHDPADAADGVVLTSYNSVISTGEIVAGNPGASEIFEKINENDPGDIMPPPPNAPLTQDQIDLIGLWISQGAQNTSCEDLFCDTLNVTFSQKIAPLVVNKCEGCHNNNTSNGGVILLNYSQISAAATAGNLWDAINGTNGIAQMPPSTGLSACEIAMFRIWIENGALDD